MSLTSILAPRICEIGKIKIGMKGEVRKGKNGDWRLPAKLDHFLLTTLARTEADDLVNDDVLMKGLVDAGFGDPDGKLRRLPIYLLSNDVADNLQAAYVWYVGKAVGARSDGKTVTWFCDPKTGKPHAQPIEEDWSNHFLDFVDSQSRPLFKLHAVFNCVIAASESRWGGVFKFRTTSRITADQLYGSMLHIHQLTAGVLMGMPLQLVVRPMQVTPGGKSTRVYVVHVELRGTDLIAIQNRALEVAKHQAENQRLIQAAHREYKALLAPPGHESAAEIEEIQAEFAAVNAEPPEQAEDDTTAGDILDEWLSQIGEANDLAGLKATYSELYAKAKAAKDDNAMTKLTAAKDAKKRELTAAKSTVSKAASTTEELI